jgi:hypothetical protein
LQLLSRLARRMLPCMVYKKGQDVIETVLLGFSGV